MARKPAAAARPRPVDKTTAARKAKAKAAQQDVLTLGEQHIGREARAVHDDHQAVKLWLRLLSCSTQIEQEIRGRLRQRFATTLPRFDYLAQLERHADGLRMNALTRYLMVTGGNVTALTDQLVAEGWVARTADPSDRRSLIVKLTRLGRLRFLSMAQEHESWLLEMLSGFDVAQRDLLYTTLGELRLHLVNRATGDTSPASRP